MGLATRTGSSLSTADQAAYVDRERETLYPHPLLYEQQGIRFVRQHHTGYRLRFGRLIRSNWHLAARARASTSM